MAFASKGCTCIHSLCTILEVGVGTLRANPKFRPEPEISDHFGSDKNRIEISSVRNRTILINSVRFSVEKSQTDPTRTTEMFPAINKKILGFLNYFISLVQAQPQRRSLLPNPSLFRPFAESRLHWKSGITASLLHC